MVATKDNSRHTSYETRFLKYLHSKFGEMVGDILLDNELRREHISEISKLSKSDQIEFMDQVMTNLFKKHDFKDAAKRARVELMMQLSLDEAAKNISNALSLNNSVYIDNLKIEYQDVAGLQAFANIEASNRFWCTTGTLMTKTLNTRAYVFTSEKQSLRQTLDYSRMKNIITNVRSDEGRMIVFRSFLSLLFNSFDKSLDKKLDHKIAYHLMNTEVTSEDFMSNIFHSIVLYESITGKNAKITSVKVQIHIGTGEFDMIIFLIY